MNDFAQPDYEPTADEIDEFLHAPFLDELQPGQHGSITMIPSFERYIWGLPIFWGHRQENSDGSITFSWCTPWVPPANDDC